MKIATVSMAVAASVMVSLCSNAFPEEKKPEHWKVVCERVSEMAEQIMTARQKNLPMSDVMVILDSDYHHKMVLDAYERPRLFGSEAKVDAIYDFKNDWYMRCVKAYRNEK